MFHLPREIIKHIYEFDPTYREEYSKSLKILDNLPAYDGYKKIYRDRGRDRWNMFWNHIYIDGPFDIWFVNSSYPPNKYYFGMLRHRKMISICAKSRVK
jgi:hypothetical protein